MSARVTEDEVKEIIEVDTSITSIVPFITVANQLVTSECTDSSLTDAILKEIERWLAAHFVAIRDMRRSSEKAGTVAENFQHSLGLNLQVTMYGQQACMLDTSGALLALSKGSAGTATVTAIEPIS